VVEVTRDILEQDMGLKLGSWTYVCATPPSIRNGLLEQTIQNRTRIERMRRIFTDFSRVRF